MREEKLILGLRMTIITVISLSAFLAVWWGLSNYLDTVYLPRPDGVFERFIEVFETPDAGTGRTMDENIMASLKRFVIGFALAFVTAVPLGMLMGFSTWAEDFAKPIVEIFRPIAPIAWAPLFVIWFGIDQGPWLVVFIGVFFPLLSNVIFGVRKIEPILIDAAKTLGAGRATMFYKVIFPWTLPFIMTGVRIGMGIGWMCIVAAEIVAARGGGIGRFIIVNANQIGDWEAVYAGLIVIAILGIMTTELSGFLEKRITKRMGIA
jgi:ABC-type nitrate/sulfonate/bicarbonate transport system permease component